MRKSTRYALVLILAVVSVPVVGAAPAETADDKAKAWWTDVKGLTWTTKDNGTGSMTWHEAGAYCRALGLGGFNDWRLPSIDELARMYDETLPEGKLRIRAPLELSKGTWWIWSGTKDASHPSQAWNLAFHTGKRYSVEFRFRRDHGRVLCVRRAGE